MVVVASCGGTVLLARAAANLLRESTASLRVQRRMAMEQQAHHADMMAAMNKTCLDLAQGELVAKVLQQALLVTPEQAKDFLRTHFQNGEPAHP